MSYSLHPGAEHDVADALNFYKQSAGPVIAARFLEEFERVAKFLVAHPDLGSPTTKSRKSIPLRIFPYSVVYRKRDNGLQILIVRHHHRKPNYGGGR